MCDILIDNILKIRGKPFDMVTKILRPLTSEKTSLGQKVKLARIARGLTQLQLAEKVYITQSGISDIERNKSEPRWTLMRDIIRVLGCEPDYFY